MSKSWLQEEVTKFENSKNDSWPNWLIESSGQNATQFSTSATEENQTQINLCVQNKNRELLR